MQNSDILFAPAYRHSLCSRSHDGLTTESATTTGIHITVTLHAVCVCTPIVSVECIRKATLPTYCVCTPLVVR